MESPSAPNAGEETEPSSELRVQPALTTTADKTEARPSLMTLLDNGSGLSATKQEKTTAAKAARMTSAVWAAGGSVVRAARAARLAALVPKIVVFRLVMISFYTVFLVMQSFFFAYFHRSTPWLPRINPSFTP